MLIVLFCVIILIIMTSVIILSAITLNVTALTDKLYKTDPWTAMPLAENVGQ